MKKHNRRHILNQKQQFCSPLQRAAVLLFWFILWEVAARQIHNSILLASPLQTGQALITLAGQSTFWLSILRSFLRITGGFLLALIAGSLLAVFSWLCPLIRELISPVLRLMKSIPVASFIILALLWVSSRNLSILISFLMVLPIIYTNLLTGIAETDNKLLEMAQVYRLPALRRFRYIYIPSVLPYLQSACSVGLGLCFKSGIAAEVIGLPMGSIGERLYEAKLYLMTPELFAWTIVIVAISYVLELLVMSMIRLLVRKLTNTRATVATDNHSRAAIAHSVVPSLSAPALQINHLHKQYGEQIVLDDVNGQIPAGTCTSLMGPSGVGKTTLLRLIAGLEPADNGEILSDPFPYPALSMVFQENRLCPDFDAITNIQLILPDLSAEEIRHEFSLVGLTDYENKPVRNLSGGMQRRVAIVRAVLASRTAPLVLLDEPLKGLDPELYLTVREYLRTSLAGTTTLLVTHNPEEAEYFAKETLSL